MKRIYVFFIFVAALQVLLAMDQHDVLRLLRQERFAKTQPCLFFIDSIKHYDNKSSEVINIIYAKRLNENHGCEKYMIVSSYDTAWTECNLGEKIELERIQPHKTYKLRIMEQMESMGIPRVMNYLDVGGMSLKDTIIKPEHCEGIHWFSCSINFNGLYFCPDSIVLNDYYIFNDTATRPLSDFLDEIP